MTIHLPEHREQFVRDLVQSGRYASEAEVIDEAVRLLRGARGSQAKPRA